MPAISGGQLGRRVGPQADVATLSVPIRTTKQYAEARWKFRVNRCVVLYPATLIVLIPIDFLFFGVFAN